MFAADNAWLTGGAVSEVVPPGRFVATGSDATALCRSLSYRLWDRTVPGSGKKARVGLQQAAIDRFLDRSLDAVTTAEIAERAGVTERTYLRHFPDRREVLFDGETDLVQVLTLALAEIPESEPPLPTLLRVRSPRSCPYSSTTVPCPSRRRG